MESKVFNEDCMIGMARYPDKYFDLAIVDPPYGIGATTNEFTNPRKRGNAVTKSTKWITTNWDVAPNDTYFNELRRVSKNQIIWGGNYFNLGATSCYIVWDKENGENLYADCELAWASFKSAVRKVKIRWHGMLQHDMKDKEERIHPTQKPVKLYKWLLDNYAVCKHCKNEGGFYEDVVGDGGSQMYVECESCDVAESGNPKILDTHLGSGSSRIACHSRGFDFTGFELDKDYFEAAEKRYQNHIKQLTMFPH